MLDEVLIMTLTIKNIDTQEYDEQYRNALITMNAIKNKIGDTRCNNGTIILSEDDLRYLIENYKKLPIEVISKKIKRKPNTIENIVCKLRLTSCYLDDDGYILYNLYKKLGIPLTNSYQFGLYKKYGFPVEEQNGFYTVQLSAFYDWFEQHRTLISLHNYVIGTLPNEPEWFIEKANADKRAIVYIFKRKWTADEDNTLKQLVNERKTYAEISKALKRTGNAIKRRCFDLNIGKPRRTPPKAWTTKQVETMRTLWLKGYQNCIIAEEIGRSDREVQAYLERKDIRYFGKPPEKFKLNTLQ